MKYLFTRKTLLIFVSLIWIISIASCNDESSLPTMDLAILRGDGSQVTLNVEIADTEETRNRGFMEREVIPDGTGMIFIFDRDQILSFWMKNTPHPLSIAYIDSTGKIRDIYHMTPLSMASWTSTVSVRYALEVPQGWFEKEGIKVGDKVLIPGKTDK